MASNNSRLLRPIVLHRQTKSVLMGCPSRRAGVRVGLNGRIITSGRRAQVVVERPLGGDMAIIRVER